MSETKTAAQLLKERRSKGLTAADIPKDYAMKTVTIAHLPEPGNLPPLTAEQLAGIMHAGAGTIGDVAYVPDECMTCSRAQYWHDYLNPTEETS